MCLEAYISFMDDSVDDYAHAYMCARPLVSWCGYKAKKSGMLCSVMSVQTIQVILA